jgi:hypothetical protein
MARATAPDSTPLATWSDLAGLFDAAVLAAPKTPGDPAIGGDYPAVGRRPVGYLRRWVTGALWADHLALIAAVLTAERCDPSTVYNTIMMLHNRLDAIFAALGLTELTAWDPEGMLRRYLRGELVPGEGPATRLNFLLDYCNATRTARRWLWNLPTAEQGRYARFLLPTVDPAMFADVLDRGEIAREQKRHRKEETDAVVPHFAALRSLAHRRFNSLTRLRHQFSEAVRRAEDGAELPFEFAYEEGTPDPEGAAPEATGVRELLHFRLWDRSSFTLAHQDRYTKNPIFDARHRLGSCSPERNTHFLEFVRAERVGDDAPPEGLWFIDLLQSGVLGSAHEGSSAGDLAARRAWLLRWGYSNDGPTPPAPFHTGTSGVLLPLQASGDSSFLRVARRYAAGPLLSVESLYIGGLFGLLAVDCFTTTGMRVNELLQISFDPDCFVRLTIPAPAGAADPALRARYLFRLLPKGERTERRHDYFIGRETARLLATAGRVLAAHYGLADGGVLPHVPFNPGHERAHRFSARPYVFQYGRRHMGGDGISACLRFLLHGLSFRTAEGRLVVLKAHLLRHAFATHAVHVEGLPVDIVGAFLKQKDLDVTEYYSAATPTMIAEAADRFLASFAARLDVGEAVLRAPEELRRQYEEAARAVGTLANVAGGQCTMHGFCPAQFACVGCSMKVPDPAQRRQVEEKRAWARAQLDWATREGLAPEAGRMEQLLRDCAAELKEMDMIEAYRLDERHAPPLRLIQPARRRPVG